MALSGNDGSKTGEERQYRPLRDREHIPKAAVEASPLTAS